MRGFEKQKKEEDNWFQYKALTNLYKNRQEVLTNYLKPSAYNFIKRRPIFFSHLTIKKKDFSLFKASPRAKRLAIDYF